MIGATSVVNGDAGVYTATLTNYIEYVATGQSFNPFETFDITVIDPCLTTNITPIVLTDGIRDINGIYVPWLMQTGDFNVEQEFDEPADDAATAVSSPLICGPKTYTVTYQNGDPQNIVTVHELSANTRHKLVAITDDENDQLTHDLLLTVHLGDPTYPTAEVEFRLIISRATCDCTLLEWQEPAPISLITSVSKEISDTITLNHSTVIPESKLPTAPIRSCYGPEPFVPCDETTVITDVIEEGSVFPAYFDLTGDVITVNAALNSQSTNYIMQVTHSTVDEGPLTFNNVMIIVNVCEITDIDPPTGPVDWWHWIHNGQATIDISSPGFVQRPACGYTLIENFEWHIATDAPIVPLNDAINLSSPDVYTLIIESTDAADRLLYTVTLDLTAEYYTTGQQYFNSVTFTIDVIDPCLETEANSIVPFSITNIAVQAGLIDV